MLLTNDTGTMHLAVAVRTPCVAIFSARDFPGKWIPWGNNHKVIRKNPDCAICFADDCQNNICMSEITIDKVYKAMEQVWSKHYANKNND